MTLTISRVVQLPKVATMGFSRLESLTDSSIRSSRGLAVTLRVNSSGSVME